MNKRGISLKDVLYPKINGIDWENKCSYIKFKSHSDLLQLDKIRVREYIHTYTHTHTVTIKVSAYPYPITPGLLAKLGIPVNDTT